jgi:hypothetical protein
MFHSASLVLRRDLPLFLAVSALLAAGGWGWQQVLPAEANQPRVLLVGDSTCGGYHAKAAELLRGKVGLDVLLTPRVINDKGLLDEIKDACQKRTYDLILFNDIGLHAWEPGHIPAGQYEPLLRAYLANFRRCAPKAKLIYATTTPMTTKTRPIAIDPQYESLICGWNRIAAKVMRENGVPLVDFYGIVAPKLEWAAGDRFHWRKQGYDLIAQAAAAAIAKSLSLSSPSGSK